MDAAEAGPAPPPSSADPVTPVALPWDFRRTFPAPLEDAFGAGILSEDDRDEAAIRSLHEEHAAECLVLLADMDALEAARQAGTDPRTGKKPRTEKSRQRLDQYLATAPAALAGKFDELMNVYENAFGEKAAGAFRAVLYAWHRGVPVLAETPVGASAEPSPLLPAPQASHAPGEDGLDVFGGPTLPNPVPLPEAIERGVFGYEDNGEPVSPSPEEVEAITAYHADRLMDLLDTRRATDSAVARAARSDRAALYQAKDRALSAYQGALGLYARGFWPRGGKPAGRMGASPGGNGPGRTALRPRPPLALSGAGRRPGADIGGRDCAGNCPSGRDERQAPPRPHQAPSQAPGHAGRPDMPT